MPATPPGGGKPPRRRPDDFALARLLRPLCPMCERPLTLAAIEPHPTDPRREIWTYRCDACRTLQRRTVEKR